MDKKYKSYDGETLAHFFKYSLVVFFKLKTKKKEKTEIHHQSDSWHFVCPS